MSQFPTLFLSHGGPNIVTDPSDAQRFLKSLQSRFDEPKAIVIASAHHEAHGPHVVSDPAPGMIYDFGGFAPELYSMVYAAPGSPVLADTILSLLSDSGFDPVETTQRGYDHGAWNPLILGFPDADVPVVQVSIDPQRDAAYHYRLGAALSCLRDQGILVIGSGHITHNLRAIFPLLRAGGTASAEQMTMVEAFTDWFAAMLEAGDVARLLDWSRLAPHADFNHPSDEHLMPLFFALGAAGEGAKGARIHASKQLGLFAWDAYTFD